MMSLSEPPAPSFAAGPTVVRSVGGAANAAAARPSIERFLRFGYVVRGVIYLIPGVLALELALGAHGGAINQTGAIELIGQQPMGRALLLVVATGLAGYTAWGLLRAVFDPLHKGRSPGGLAKRFGFVMSALAHAGLLVATLRFLVGTVPHAAAGQDWSARLLARPFGAWMVGIIGLGWIGGSGIGEIIRGWRAEFVRDLALERTGAGERTLALLLGRFGTVARGVVFTIVGVLLVAAAMHVKSHSAGGLDGALLELARQPIGRVLLAAAALGLMAFGAFSVMCARWMRMLGATDARHKPSSHPVPV